VWGKFNYGRVKSRRPLQIQQQLQRRPAKAGRYKFNGKVKGLAYDHLPARIMVVSTIPRRSL
jgi:hypothetical protein